MFKSVKNEVWAFDAEWVPDPQAGRALYELSDEMADEAVVTEMWRKNGATEEVPQPFLKLAISRVVSIALVRRTERADGKITVDLRSRPKDPSNPEDCSEGSILGGFLNSVGMLGPQLVGFNSGGSDLPIFIQRGIINGIQATGFCTRPDKPWEGRDYFARDSEWNIDLMTAIGGWSKAQPSLKEIARQSGIPCKLGEIDGGGTARAWLDGDLAGIVRYNEHDALTTYLVWLRVAHFAGHFTTEQYQVEQALLRTMLERRAAKPGNDHLAEFINAWVGPAAESEDR